jgi:hypothetical protein
VREDCERTRLDLQVRYSAATEICREIAERRAQRAARGAA